MSKKELADIAFQSENYQKAYNYYSEIVEDNIEKPEAWIGMGLSAGYLSDYENNFFKEAETCLKKAQELGFKSNDLSQKIAHHIPKITEEYFDKMLTGINKDIDDEDKKSMATGQFHGTRVIELETKRLALNLDNFSNYMDAIEFSESAYSFSQNIDVIKDILKSINKLLNQTQKLPDDLKDKIKTKRKKWIEKGNEIDSSFNPREFQTNTSEGCFIATACYGNYNAPEVLILRKFRDKFLSKSVLGKIFIKFYYAKSPKYAKILKRKSKLRYFTKILFIRPLVIISKKIIATLPI